MAKSTEPKYRDRLPQMNGQLFLTDGGLETTLIFHEGWELPCFAAFPLLESEKGRNAIRKYYDRYIPLALEHGMGFVLDGPTWRANPDWAAKIGYDRSRLAKINHDSIAFQAEIRDRYETARSPIVVSGVVGPRGDGYDPGQVMSVDEAQAYHAWQVGIFRDAGADYVSAYTLSYVNEAIGFALALRGCGHAVCRLLHGRDGWTTGDRRGARQRRSLPWMEQPGMGRPTT